MTTLFGKTCARCGMPETQANRAASGRKSEAGKTIVPPATVPPTASLILGRTLHRLSLCLGPRNRELPRRARDVHPRIEPATVEELAIL